MTKEDVYQIALSMDAEEQAKFKAFLSALLESGDTAQLLASGSRGSAE